MRRIAPLLAILALAALPSCRTVPDDVALPTVCEAINSSRSAVGTSRDTAAAVFGTPSATQVLEQPNRHVPDATDRIHTLTFQSGQVVIHEARPIERELLTSITATRRTAPVLLASYIGRTRQQVTTELGPPATEQQNTASWACESEAGPEQLTLTFAGGEVTAARAEYYVD